MSLSSSIRSPFETWLALVHAPRLGAVKARRLLERAGGAAALAALDAAELAKLGVEPPAAEALVHPDRRAIERDLRWLEGAGHHLVTMADPGYPRALAALPDAPVVLYVQGNVCALARSQVAVIGSRRPTHVGAEVAHEFAMTLAASGLAVTSGLAEGIDAAGHRGALEADGVTLAVCGTGLDRVYPRRHRDLAGRIADAGALVSEFPPGTPPRREHFPRRNRIISGLGLGVVVVEAARRSGSLITARFAAEQGREVFAVPGAVTNPVARGCHELIRQGARLVESPQEVLEELGPQLPGASALESAPDVPDPGLDPVSRTVLDALSHGPAPVDVLVERCGLTAQVVSSILCSLELQGRVARESGAMYSPSRGLQLPR